MSPDYKVRQAGLHDLDSLMLLEEMVFHAAEYHLIGRRQYRYFLQEANAEIWVVEIDGQVRASAILFYQKIDRIVGCIQLQCILIFKGRVLARRYFVSLRQCCW